MNQDSNLFEKNVQWIALGLAGLFCLLMVYGYVLTPVAVVEVNKTLTGPATVDKEVARTAERLQEAMNASGVPAGLNPRASITSAFSEELATANWQVAPFTGKPMFHVPGMEVATVTVDPGRHVPVAKLQLTPPEPVIPTFMHVSAGRARVLVPGPPAPAPLFGAPGAPGERPWLPEDKYYAINFFKVDLVALAQRFTDAKLPRELQNSMFLQVDAVREEWDDARQAWVNATAVKPLLIHEIEKVPSAAGRAPQQIVADNERFLAWARNRTTDILTPPFYQVVEGDRPLAPGEKREEVAPQVVDAPFDPANPPADRELTPEERRAVLAVQQERIREERRQRAERAKQLEEERRQRMESDRRRTTRDRTNVIDTASIGPGLAGEVLEGLMLTQMNPEDEMVDPPWAGNPGGQFNPAQQMANLPGFVQLAGAFPLNPPPGAATMIAVPDADLLPGKQYRWRVRYWLLNPLFGQAQFAAKAADAQKLAISSQYSEWTAPVRMPDAFHLFLAANPAVGLQPRRFAQSPQARFLVYKWEQGRFHMQEHTASVGDVIGRPDATSKIDFSTGWMVVDVRSVNNRAVVMICDPDGNVERRDADTDRAHPLQQVLRQQVMGAAASPANPAAPAPVRPPRWRPGTPFPEDLEPPM